MERLSVALALALGCSSSSSDAPAPSPASRDAGSRPADAAPIEVVTPAGEDEGAGPRVTLSLLGRYKDPSFGAVDLPAVSADGRRVAFVRERLDGGRGNPNLSLVIRDTASGRDLEVIDVLPVEPRFSPEDEPAVRARLAEANRRLAAGSWKPMTQPSFDDATIDGDTVTLAIGPLTVRARGDRLEIARGRQVVARRQLRSWLGPGDQGCPVSPRLRNAHAAASLVVVELGFEGADGCWRETVHRIIRL